MNNLFSPLDGYSPNSSQFGNLLGVKFGEPIKVNGKESVDKFPMLPNSRVVLFDSNEDVFYCKETDANNVPNIRTFGFTEIKPIPKAETTYVTLEQFNKFKEELLNGKQYIWNSTNAPIDAGTGGQSTASCEDDEVDGARPITSANATKSPKSKSTNK